MTDKELKRLNRSELLQILLEQSIEIERLQQELDEAKKNLAKRELLISESGTLAEAALKLNRIFADADAAAALYLENIRRMAEVPVPKAEDTPAVDPDIADLDAAIELAIPEPREVPAGKKRRRSRRKHEA